MRKSENKSFVVKGLDLAAEIAGRQPELLGLIEALVKVESPSDSPADVNACAALAEKFCMEAGGKVRTHRQKQFGNILEAQFGPRKRGAKPILLLGHLDTVWPLGTLKTMPYRIADGRVWGPGVLDMKAGVAMALTALRFLIERDLLDRPVTMLLVSEEEVGSPVSRAVTEKIAADCSSVFVLEPAQGLAGAYKTARKGIGNYGLKVTGVAAHSGVDFEKGHSAVVELARQIEVIQGFTEQSRGITVNVGTIRGGTRSNVVAAEAWAEIDVRIPRIADAGRIEKKFARLKPRDKGCTLHLEGGWNRPPMERTKGTVTLFRQAATFARNLGFDLQEASTGGGSDGNFTSALGVPTLDGMGAVGEGAHARHESILLKDLAPRTALLAAMLCESKV
ncbi:M20 family metallopeptidase [Silvibacterium acidisoli]|uniref:M20 family metallopeptidase n=1 Tax=Acidobacteriaceae bacterium ZG23-2 TaxID=2883246 RepID=UPI00406CF3CE